MGMVIACWGLLVLLFIVLIFGFMLVGLLFTFLWVRLVDCPLVLWSEDVSRVAFPVALGFMVGICCTRFGVLSFRWFVSLCGFWGSSFACFGWCYCLVLLWVGDLCA